MGKYLEMYILAKVPPKDLKGVRGSKGDPWTDCNLGLKEKNTRKLQAMRENLKPYFQ